MKAARVDTSTAPRKGLSTAFVRTMAALAACMLCVLAFAGCAADAPSSQEGQASSAPTEQTSSAQYGMPDDFDFRNPDLGNGWDVERSMDVRYAQCFSVDYYAGGYKLFCLMGDQRFLVVPEGAEEPEGIAGDIVVLQQPVDHVYLVASDTMCLYDALDKLDAIAVSGTKAQDWSIPAAAEAMERGDIVYGGKYSMPDYDVLLQNDVDLSIQSTMINHTPDVREKLIDLGIPVLTEMSSYESAPLGRTEWVKLYAALYDLEDAADALFDEQEQKAQVDVDESLNKTVAFFYINSNGAAVVRKPGDYVTNMISLAGGTYVFDTLGEQSAMSTVTMEMEQFYATAKDADIIIYNANIDGSINSIEALVAKNALLADFKAVQEGNVWRTDQNMYQQMMNTGGIIEDFNRVFKGQTDNLTYVTKLD